MNHFDEDYSNYPLSNHILTKIPVIQRVLLFAAPAPPRTSEQTNPAQQLQVSDPKSVILLSNYVTSSWSEAMVSPQFQTLEMIWDKVWKELKTTTIYNSNFNPGAGAGIEVLRGLAARNTLFAQYCCYFNRLIYYCCTSDRHLWMLKRLFSWKTKVRNADLPPISEELIQQRHKGAKGSTFDRMEEDTDEVIDLTHEKPMAERLLKKTNPIFPFFSTAKNPPTTSQGCYLFSSPLIVSCAFNQPNIVRFLLTAKEQGGAGVVYVSSDVQSHYEIRLGAAHEAARFGSLETLKVLAEFDNPSEPKLFNHRHRRGCLHLLMIL
jgi:hypothetical protein